MKFNKIRSKGSGDTERIRKCYGGKELTDEGHSYDPLPLRGGGFKDKHIVIIQPFL